MSHITEEEMVDGYYTGAELPWRSHLENCAQCSTLYRNICETLESASEAGMPARGTGYGAEVWARVSAELPVNRARWRAWAVVPVLGSLMALALVMWNERSLPPPNAPPVQIVSGPVVVKPSIPVIARAPAPRHAPVSRKAVVSDQQLLALNSRLETDAKSALPELLRVIKSDVPNTTKEHALFVLAQSDSVEAHHALLTLASESSNTALKNEAVKMMELPNSGRLSFSIAGMPKNDKKQILNSVFMASDSQVLENILKREPNPDLRVATVRSLAVMSERSQVLVNIYRVDSDANVRRAVLDALVAQRNSDALVDLARGESDLPRKAEILSRLATIRTHESVK